MEANDTPFKEDGGVISDAERYFRHCTESKDDDSVEGDVNSDRDALFSVLVGKAQVSEKVRNMDVTDEDEEELTWMKRKLERRKSSHRVADMVLALHSL
ncbi:hypothetical protein PsorP6_016242 [Peronosclerospora sorghi]|uniref:Uncharacterized protein n=1 Tax=Peronosclerospora sorghi TaxID=230839 RepID=A0ACC0VPZ5_9STRA|nr:hypothetical protein PsorP6_016242 [Peronosclerospora sorghi]